MDKLTVDCATGDTTSAPLTTGETAQREADESAAAALQWPALRSDRNARLVACDWTQLADNELGDADVQAWAGYRQQLRDLPEQTADPANPDWPEPPPTPSEIAG